MGKVLRIFIVLLLLLCVAALVFEVLLFNQREQLKGRTQRLEQGLVAVSQKLTAPRDPHIQAIDQQVDTEALKQYETMDRPIGLVETLVDNRAQELFDSRAELEQTRNTLEETRQVLAKTRQDLQQTRDQVARLEKTVDNKNREIAGLNDTVREKDDLIAQHTSTIEELKNDVADLRDEQENLEAQIARLERLIPEEEATEAGRRIPVGFKGNVVLVEPEWNFVILDVGSEEGLVPNVELLVHRDEEFIGRIRVVSVLDHIAVADIQRETKMSSMLKGDSVFFPGG